MSCRICGDEHSTYDFSRRMALCPDCLRGTPAKVSREQFDRAYWGACANEAAPASVRREFYADYLASRHTLSGYIYATTHVD